MCSHVNFSRNSPHRSCLPCEIVCRIHSFRRSSIQIFSTQTLQQENWNHCIIISVKFDFLNITFFLKNYLWWEKAPCWSQELVKRPFLNVISGLQNIQLFSVRWGLWKNLRKNLKKYRGIFKMIFEIQWKFQKHFQNFRLNFMWTIKNFKIWRKNLENFDYLYFQEIKGNFCKYFDRTSRYFKAEELLKKFEDTQKILAIFKENLKIFYKNCRRRDLQIYGNVRKF